MAIIAEFVISNVDNFNYNTCCMLLSIDINIQI